MSTVPPGPYRAPSNTSVTQIDTFRDCNRKWYLGWVVRMPRTQHASAIRGLSGHDANEKFAKAMRLLPHQPPLDIIEEEHRAFVLKALPYMPLPMERAGIEIDIDMPTAPGLPPLHGKIDVFRYDINPITLVDWKFISDMRYAKRTPEEIVSDLQTNIYSEWAYQTIEAEGLSIPDFIKAGLVYFEAPKDPKRIPKKKGPRTLPSFAELRREGTRRVWNDAIETVREQREVAKIKKFQDVTPNPLACGSYGGCPHRTICGLSPLAGLGSNKKRENDVSFFEQMKSKGINGTNGAGKAVSQTAPPTTAKAASPFGAKTTTAATNNAATPTRPSPFGAKGTTTVTSAPASAPKAASPFGAKAPSTPAPSAPPKAASPFGAPRPAPAAAQGILPDDAPPRETGAAPDPGTAEAEPKKRGRKTNAQKAAEAAEAAAEAAAAAAQEAEQEVVEEVQEELESQHGAGNPLVRAEQAAENDFTLYIDCAPMKDPYGAGGTLFDDWIRPIVHELNHQAMSYKDVPDFRLLAYSDEKALFAAVFTQWITDRGLPPALIVTSSSPLAKDAVPLLTPFAARVIRGLRG